MNSLLIQIAALTSSFLLAMPAGWCGGWMHDSAASAPAEAACCQPSCHDPAADPLEIPSSPTVDCCCSWDATMPQKGGELSDSSSLAAGFAAADFTTDRGSAKLSETVSKPVRYGPRLHVLQCVWRC